MRRDPCPESTHTGPRQGAVVGRCTAQPFTGSGLTQAPGERAVARTSGYDCMDPISWSFSAQIPLIHVWKRSRTARSLS